MPNEIAIYHAAQVFDLTATSFDVAQTRRGLGWGNPLEREAGDARWFVNPRSAGQVHPRRRCSRFAR